MAYLEASLVGNVAKTLQYTSLKYTCDILLFHLPQDNAQSNKTYSSFQYTRYIGVFVTRKNLTEQCTEYHNSPSIASLLPCVY